MTYYWTVGDLARLRAHWHRIRDADAARLVGRSVKACKVKAWRLRDDPDWKAMMAEREFHYRDMLNADKQIRFLAWGYRPPGNRRQQLRRAAHDLRVGCRSELAGRDDGGAVRQC